MNERAVWISVVLSVAAVGGYLFDRTSHSLAIERAAHSRIVDAQSETIGALRSALRDAKTVALAAHAARKDCEQGLGLAALRQSWIDKQLGLSTRLVKETP